MDPLGASTVTPKLQASLTRLGGNSNVPRCSKGKTDDKTSRSINTTTGLIEFSASRYISGHCPLSPSVFFCEKAFVVENKTRARISSETRAQAARFAKSAMRIDHAFPESNVMWSFLIHSHRTNVSARAPNRRRDVLRVSVSVCIQDFCSLTFLPFFGRHPSSGPLARWSAFRIPEQ